METYCVCRQPYRSKEDDAQGMIECDHCQEWFHARCVGLTPNDEPEWNSDNQKVESQHFQNIRISQIKVYYCPECAKSLGPGKLKLSRKNNAIPRDRIKRTRVKVDYLALHDGSVEDVAVHPTESTIDYEAMLKRKQFSAFEQVQVCGEDESIPAPETHFLYTFESGMDFKKAQHHAPIQDFVQPMLVRNAQGLGVRVPDSWSVRQVAETVGPKMSVPVMDVATQTNLEGWNLEKWADYYEHYSESKNSRILNVISLEVSKSPLGEQLKPPDFVLDRDWCHKVWPKSEMNSEDESRQPPRVLHYVLMSVAGCYTDFHIDFGGSSVFYHLVHGAKWFYFVPPTAENLIKYADWSSSPRQSRVFFGDLLPPHSVMAIKLVAGQTLFIPSGWIHAVYTPEASLVFGGNFLHGAAMARQVQIRLIERRTSVPAAYCFPQYELLLWHALSFYVTQLENGVELSKSERNGLPHLMKYLESEWNESKMQLPTPLRASAPKLLRKLSNLLV